MARFLLHFATRLKVIRPEGVSPLWPTDLYIACFSYRDRKLFSMLNFLLNLIFFVFFQLAALVYEENFNSASERFIVLSLAYGQELCEAIRQICQQAQKEGKNQEAGDRVAGSHRVWQLAKLCGPCKFAAFFLSFISLIGTISLLLMANIIKFLKYSDRFL